MNINITCSTDEHYIQHCMAMLCSLFENHKQHSITVHLLHHNLLLDSQKILLNLASRYNNAHIIFYNIDESLLGDLHIKHPDLSIATYYRLLLPSIISNTISTLLYLDCDVIVLKDISELFELEMEEYGVAAVKDPMPGTVEHRAILGMELGGQGFCAGVMVINLNYWRKHNCQKSMLKFARLNLDKLFMEDQDVLNHEFRNHWFKLPYKYAKSPMSIACIDNDQLWSDIIEYNETPSIIHYATHAKPWLDIRIPNDQYYWKYLEISAYPYPKKFKPTPRNRKRIIISKTRYYINRYIRPFVPNILEIIITDIATYILFLVSLGNFQKFKEKMLKVWYNKYK